MSLSNEQKHTLTVEIIDLKANKGTVLIAIYNSEKTFLNKPFLGKVKKVSTSEGSIFF